MAELNTVFLLILAFIVVLGPLVALHEFGNYIVARLCGVKVLTYSIGFGPNLASWTSKKTGINYRLSALPLGGYVKMLDEREGKVADSEKHLAFNNQHPLKKIAIVLAGPVMNFIIAIALFAVLFMTPTEQLTTTVFKVLPDTPAMVTDEDLVGKQIVSVDGHRVQTWEDINYRLADRMGETGTVSLGVSNLGDKLSNQSGGEGTRAEQTATYALPIDNYMQGDDKGLDTLSALGVLRWEPNIEPVIDQLAPEGSAMRQGMQTGDKIIAIDGTPIPDWLTATRIIQRSPETLLSITVLREGKQMDLSVMPQAVKDRGGNVVGRIGAGVAQQDIVVPDEYKTMVQYEPLPAVAKAFMKTGQLAEMTLNSFRKMIVGQVGLDNISGPIGIAVVSKQSFEIGLLQVLSIAGLISLSLAVLNLLPIPMLDGGHLLYYVIELIRGKPVSEQAQMVGFNLGFLMLIGFMVVAISNDLGRVVF